MIPPGSGESDRGAAGAAPQRPGFTTNVATALGGNLFPPLAALATAPILAHTLGVDGRGQVAAAMGPYLLVTTVSTLGIPEAVTYAVARSHAVAGSVSRRGLAVVATAGLISTVAVLAASGWLSAGDPTTRSLIVLASTGMVPALCLGVLRATASGLQRWRLVTYERIWTSVTKLALIASLAWFGALTPLTATATMVVAPLLGAIPYAALRTAVRESRTEPGAPPPRLLSYGFRVWLGSMSGIVLARIDQTLLTPLAGTYQLGLYVVAVTVGEVPLVINSAVRDVVFASQAADPRSDRLAASARISFAACLGSALVLAPLLPWAIPVVFSDEFRPAVGPALLVLAAATVVAPGSVAGASLSASGRPGLRSAMLAIACVVNVVVLILLVPTSGAMGAGYATLIGSATFSAGTIVLASHLAGTRVRDFLGVRSSDIAFVARTVRSALHRAWAALTRRRGNR